ncbi:MAG TPA: hypothetical protein VJ304_16235, partial [Flavobacterium sp.]|nr:hypothetical protein [Flavobacterium sp.]
MFAHNLQNSFPENQFFYLAFITLVFTFNTISAQEKERMIRISEIEIYPEYLSKYKAILKEEAAASVKLEPGVLAI